MELWPERALTPATIIAPATTGMHIRASLPSTHVYEQYHFLFYALFHPPVYVSHLCGLCDLSGDETAPAQPPAIPATEYTSLPALNIPSSAALIMPSFCICTTPHSSALTKT